MSDDEKLTITIKDEGCSTLLFDAYIAEYGGELHSVDINPVNVEYAQTVVGDSATVYCNDSVAFLGEANRMLAETDQYIDLLYLDSLDFQELTTFYESPVHHLKELCAVISRMKKGSMLVVDDNYMEGAIRKGKGMYIAEFMKSIGVPLLHDQVHMIWKF
jgi:predicted O-methyltransferase YrrM